MAEYEKKVRQILTPNGCTFHRRGKGDHDIWYSPITKRHITVDTKKIKVYCKRNHEAKRN